MKSKIKSALYLGELVDALARVVGVHVGVLCAEVAPLEPVDGAQVPFLAIGEALGVQVGPRGIAVPNANIFVLRTRGKPLITQ